MLPRTRRKLGVLLAVAGAATVLAPLPADGEGDDGSRRRGRAKTVVGVDFLGEVVVPTGTIFDGTEIGGLSSITYDRTRDRYHALSDDQGNRPTGDPVRLYSVEIDLSDGSFDDGDLEFVDTTELLDVGNVPFEPGGLDPEGLTLGTRRASSAKAKSANTSSEMRASPCS